ncbi:efflux RND transporter permease subunit, partial [Bacillus sp. Nf3]|uniref:efflux RND transporter permease subunit n=1 Tax=Bacillus sp. Nf3 TaxID=2116541 RepID=UPI002159ABDE
QIDRTAAARFGLTANDIDQVLYDAFGQRQINEFQTETNQYRVILEIAPSLLGEVDALSYFHLRSPLTGQMVPLSSLVSAHWTSAPAALQRYNGISAMEITGQPAPGVSSGEAMAEIARLADTLPEGFSHAWSDMAYQEQLSGNQAPMLYAISLLFVFLCLAALYESWAVPFA